MSRLVVAAGPSLTQADRKALSGVDFVPPVGEGDILRLASARPAAIGIVDGLFGDRLAVGHKEVLWAMAHGIAVYGAASIGALRAAELDGFGMVGVGEIYRGYRTGALTDDGDVALLHAPADLGYRPLTVALVDVRATLSALVARERLSAAGAAEIETAAAAVHFAERTWRRVADASANSMAESDNLCRELSGAHVERKRLDALEMVRRMLADAADPPPRDRPFWPPHTPAFRAALRRAGLSGREGR